MAEKVLIAYSNEEKKEVDRCWSELPLELLCLVSSHLLAGDFIALRAVCKSWRSSTSLIRPLSPLSLDSSHSLFPCLMSADYYKCRFYHPTYYGADHMDIPELLGARIRFSKYGWLLLTRDDWSVFFFNPFTKAKVELPHYTNCKGFETMCFSTPPTSSDCFVLGICCPLFFGIIKRGEESWTFPDFTGRQFQVSNCNPILCKGLCYCLDVYGNVGVFDPNGNPSQWTVYDLKTPFSKEQLTHSICQSYLVEANDGKLLAVFMVEKDSTPIYIFEVTLSNLLERKGTRLWHVSSRRVKSLGNKMIYISLGGSFLEPAGATRTSNKIYLPVIQDNKNVFYSLDTAMYKAFPSDYSSKFPYHVQELRNCCWIKRTPELTFDQDIEWY